MQLYSFEPNIITKRTFDLTSLTNTWFIHNRADLTYLKVYVSNGKKLKTTTKIDITNGFMQVH